MNPCFIYWRVRVKYWDNPIVIGERGMYRGIAGAHSITNNRIFFGDWWIARDALSLETGIDSHPFDQQNHPR